jgi:transposase-like protein
MNKSSTQCPACGSYETIRHEKRSFGQLTLGENFSFKEIYYVCDSCHEEGDFLAETDENYSAAEKKAQANLVKKTLDDMNSMGITMAMLERVLELPIRTLTRWKNGDFSASALALLRILATYPWIIEVAEHKFNKKYALCSIVTAAANALQEKNQTPSLDYGKEPTASGNAIPFFTNQTYGYNLGA